MRKNQDRQLSRRLICIPLLSLLLLNQAHAGESWKRPLAEKAEIIEAGIQKRHNILGLYPSMVEIPFDSDRIDITTLNPMADVQHAVCWTANYLAGLSYRHAYEAIDAYWRARYYGFIDNNTANAQFENRHD